MFNSLRSRLWFTYALLSLTILCVVGTGLVIYLLRNPPATGRTYQRLELLALSITRMPGLVNTADLSQSSAMLVRIDTTFDARIILLDAGGDVMVDTRVDQAPAIPRTVYALLKLKLTNSTLNQLRFVDAKLHTWLYVARRINGDRILIVAAPRPVVQLRQILREDLIPPLFRAGLGAMVLAIPLAFWMAHWVTNPLQRMKKSLQALASGKHEPIPVDGPVEVQEFAQSFNNMSERVQATQQSQRELVANVSHDLKTPLTSIQGFAQAILDGTASTKEEQNQAASVIFDEADRMTRMVNDLLELARIDAGIANFVRQTVDISTLLQSLTEKLQPQATQKQVSLRSEIEPLTRIIGDEDRLMQAFSNLVENALKFTPAQGQVYIRARQILDQVEVSISDTGPGITIEDMPHIFDRFYQADKSRSQTRAGSGLGLAITKVIIDAHFGTIQATSSPGQGSTFVVTLPVVLPDDSTMVKSTRGNQAHDHH